MELATALHHSAQRPGKKVVEEPEEEEVHVTHDALRGLKTLPPQVVAVVPWPPQLGTVRVAPPFAEVPSLALPSLGDDAGHDVTSTQFLLRCALAQREREREKEAEAELFSQSARPYRAVEGKWELDVAGDAKLFHNSVTGLSSFTFVYEHNHQSLSS